MTIADKTQYWQLKMEGTDPTVNTNAYLKAWTATGSGGSSTNDIWTITDQRLAYTPTGDAYTMFAVLTYGGSTPNNNEVLMKLDNGTHKVEVQATGNNQTVKLVGASTAETSDLDLKMLDDYPVPVMLRLTLDASGNARLYMREIIEDDDAQTHYLSVTGASGSSKTIEFGNNTGTVNWYNVYASYDGAFSPDELSHSEFVSDIFVRTGLKMIETLRNSKRPFLKGIIDNSSIVYGYDISTSMITRIPAPSIHVLVKGIGADEIQALGGHRIDNTFEVEVFILTRGTNYIDTYRSCLSLTGDVYDEVITNLGLDSNNDALVNYELELDTKVDEDEVVCVHKLQFSFMRRSHLQRR